MADNGHCPSCNSEQMVGFYHVDGVPANSVVLLTTRDAALAYPRGDLSLAFCQNCGFIGNVAFDSSLLEYASGYEATQSFSPTFNTFARRLASRLVDEYDLHGKDVIEIGCGQGEFLTMLCELGHNRGIGFDPAYIGTRSDSEALKRITFVKDFYSEKYADHCADFVVCKMTLEHIPDTADFVSMVRRSLGDRRQTVVFFQVPDVRRVLQELAFWDIYYEHCSYFSLGSLARLFRRCGFDVVRLAREYGDQYLMVEARPGDGTGGSSLDGEEAPEDLAQDVKLFTEQCGGALDRWKRDLQKLAHEGRRVVLWGGGSKAVAFLTTLGLGDAIQYVVDINPHKHGTYIAGTGQEIVAPLLLQEIQPHVVVVMNPIYREEIGRDLERMGLNVDLMTV